MFVMVCGLVNVCYGLWVGECLLWFVGLVNVPAVMVCGLVNVPAVMVCGLVNVCYGLWVGECPSCYGLWVGECLLWFVG